MKNFLFVSAIVLAFGLTSCTKDYTCTCTSTDSSGTIADIVTTVTYNDSKKSDAEDACTNAESTVGTISTTCVLD